MRQASQAAYRCVIFDLDGTLLDTRGAMLAAIDATLAENGHAPVEASRLTQAMHFGLPAMLRAALAGTTLAEEVLAALSAQVTARYLETAASRVTAFDDVPRLLQRLRADGIWLGICSNQSEHAARHLLASRGLTTYFRAVVGGDTLGMRKPDPRPLRWLMERAGAATSETLMVGDSEIDWQTAGAAGTDAVLMRHGYGSAAACAGGIWLDSFGALERHLYNSADQSDDLLGKSMPAPLSR